MDTNDDWVAIGIMGAVGLARVQCSRMEKGLEQSRIEAGIFSRISYTIFGRRFKKYYT